MLEKSFGVSEFKGLILLESLAGCGRMGGANLDAVFSNAALHWMKRDPPRVVAGVKAALRPGGRQVLYTRGVVRYSMNQVTVL